FSQNAAWPASARDFAQTRGNRLAIRRARLPSAGNARSPFTLSDWQQTPSAARGSGAISRAHSSMAAFSRIEAAEAEGDRSERGSHHPDRGLIETLLAYDRAQPGDT